MNLRRPNADESTGTLIDPRTLLPCPGSVQDASMDVWVAAKFGYPHSEAVKCSTLDPSEK